MLCFSPVAAQKWFSSHCLIPRNVEDVIPPNYFLDTVGIIQGGDMQGVHLPLTHSAG